VRSSSVLLGRNLSIDESSNRSTLTMKHNLTDCLVINKSIKSFDKKLVVHPSEGET
jgi:hypothetical protein